MSSIDVSESSIPRGLSYLILIVSLHQGLVETVSSWSLNEKERTLVAHDWTKLGVFELLLARGNEVKPTVKSHTL